MRKWFISMLALVLLVSGGASAAAQSNKHSGKPEYSKYCKQLLASLNQALANAKSESAKDALRDYIDTVTEKCKGTSNNGLTDSERVAKDKNALQIRYRSGDSASKVTGPVVLVAKGQYGSAISWKSSDPSVIANDGLTVKRQAADKKVILTATIKYNSAKQTKSFTLTVKAADQTDAQRVAKDKAALRIAFNGTDNADHITGPLKPLPTKGESGSTIKWYSGDPSIISADGQQVNRPSSGKGDAVVAFTAIIQYGSAADIVTFKLTVKSQLQDAQRVAADKAALQIDFGGSDKESSVTRPFDQLPAKGGNGSTIIWTSSMPSVISNDGKIVKRPAHGSSDAVVVMSAILTAGSASDIKIFVLTVKADYSNTEKVAADKAALQITFAEGNSTHWVTKPLTLPTKGVNGSTITWYSNSPSLISDNGKTVNRPEDGRGDAEVTLMAFVTYDGVSDLKTFTVTVKEK